MNKKIHGFKAFDADLKCRDFQYEIGKTYVHNGIVSACNSGFHFCENPLDVFAYYSPSTSRFAKVIGGGETQKHREDSKVACGELEVVEEIGLVELVAEGVKKIIEGADFNSAATNTGDQSAATNTGYQSAATNTGNRSAATNTGDQSAATNTGYQSAATNTGNRSAATNTGYQSAAINTGYQSAAINTGNRSAATNTGYQSAAINTGYQSAAINTGNRSAVTVEGKDSVAIVTGYDSKARGALGCWLVLTERNRDMEILNIVSVKIDGENIKENIFYSLREGVIVEA